MVNFQPSYKKRFSKQSVTDKILVKFKDPKIKNKMKIANFKLPGSFAWYHFRG